MNYPLLLSGLLFSSFFISSFASEPMDFDDDSDSCASSNGLDEYVLIGKDEVEEMAYKGNFEEEVSSPKPVSYPIYCDAPAPPKVAKTLIEAAKATYDNTAVIKDLLAAGAKVEETDGIGRNCLYYALTWDFTPNFSNFFALLKGAGKKAPALLDATFPMNWQLVSVRQVATTSLELRPDLLAKMTKIEEESQQ